MLNNVREEMIVFMQTHNVSQNALARALGVNPAAISTFRRGEYKGNNEELANKIEKYMRNYATKDKKERVARVFSSNDKKMADFIMTESYNDNQIGLIIGTAGSGKSTIVQEWAHNHPNTILIEATLHTTAKVLLQTLLDELNLNRTKSLHEAVVVIAKELKRRDVMIIIDEAEHLPLKALEDLRRIWDFSGVPLVLVGTEILLSNLMGKNGELRQLYSRIDSKWNMRGLSKEECDGFYTKGVYEYSRGNFRASNKLFIKANKLARMHDVELSSEVIANASSMLVL